MCSVLRREVAPEATVMAPFASRHSRANNLISAAFALPSSGGAVTEIARWGLPSAATATPLIAARDALGVTLTATVTPSGATAIGERPGGAKYRVCQRG